MIPALISLFALVMGIAMAGGWWRFVKAIAWTIGITVAVALAVAVAVIICLALPPVAPTTVIRAGDAGLQ